MMTSKETASSRRCDIAVGAIKRTVGEWAAGEPLIRRVYLFGSRARGDDRPDSDVDLALVCRMEPRILAECGGDRFSARMFFWSDRRPEWEATLARLLSLPVHLEVLDRDTTLVVRPAVKRDGIRLV